VAALFLRQSADRHRLSGLSGLDVIEVGGYTPDELRPAFATRPDVVFKLPLVVLRLFGVFGPGEAPRRLVPYLVDRLRQGEAVDLTPGTQVRDLLYIDDAADAFVRAADAPSLGDDGQVYNVCSGVPVAVRQVGDTVARLLDAPPESLRWGAIPPRTEEPPWIVGDGERFRSATGWQPKFDLTAGLKATIAARMGSSD